MNKDINRMNEQLDTLLGPKPRMERQYMFTFRDGGWNTCWAKTLRGAKTEAIRQYADSDTLWVNVDSVHLATKEGLKNAMNTFY